MVRHRRTESGSTAPYLKKSASPACPTEVRPRHDRYNPMTPVTRAAHSFGGSRMNFAVTALVAKDDGLYWFQIVTIDRQGRKDPANVTAEPPALKVLVDTVKPVVRFTNARRNGEEVLVEWEVRDKYPDDSATRVFFRPANA